MRKTLLGLIWGALVLGAFPAAAAATPVNQTPPTVGGILAVGSSATCAPGTWTSTPGGNNLSIKHYDWFHADDLSHVIGVDTGIHSPGTYNPVAADVNHQLVCRVTVVDETDNTTATADSGPSARVIPEASIRLTNDSPVISGTIGELVNGVGVKVSLIRTTNAGSSWTVATASTTTTTIAGRDGSWTLSLPGHGFGGAGDALHVVYSPGSTSAPVPVSAVYGSSAGTNSGALTFFGAHSQVSSDGTTISTKDFSLCRAVRFLVNGGTHETAPAPGGGCQAAVSPAATDNARIQVALTGTVPTAGHASDVTMVDSVGLLGVTTAGSLGPPTCTADLVFTTVTCNQLNGGAFAVARDGGTPIALHKSSVPNTGTFIGTAVVPGLKGGDTVVLNETSPRATTRGITALHVGALRVDLTAGKTIVSGACQPYAVLIRATNAQPPGGLCSLSGKMSATDNSTGQLDDLSGGSTVVNVPTLSNLIPTASGSVPSGPFISFADIDGPGTTAQILAATSKTELKIVPHAGGAATFDGLMTKGSDSSGAHEQTTVPAQSSGAYFANWVLTDVNGDTNSYQNTFVIEPSGGGARTSGQSGSG